MCRAKNRLSWISIELFDDLFCCYMKSCKWPNWKPCERLSTSINKKKRKKNRFQPEMKSAVCVFIQFVYRNCRANVGNAGVAETCVFDFEISTRSQIPLFGGRNSNWLRLHGWTTIPDRSRSRGIPIILSLWETCCFLQRSVNLQFVVRRMWVANRAFAVDSASEHSEWTLISKLLVDQRAWLDISVAILLNGKLL